MKYLIVDGYLNGTGIRDKYAGGCIKPEGLGVSETLSRKICLWLQDCWEAFYTQHPDKEAVRRLDTEGRRIAARVKAELIDVKVEYFSDAKTTFDKMIGA